MGVGNCQNRENWNFENFDSSVDIQKSHEDPRNSHNRDNWENNFHQSSDCNTVPAHRQAGPVVDNQNRNENHSHNTRMSRIRIGAVEVGRKHPES